MTFENIPLLFFKRDEFVFCASKASFCSHFHCSFQNFETIFIYVGNPYLKSQNKVLAFIFHEQFNFFQKIMSKVLAERLRSRDPENFSGPKLFLQSNQNKKHYNKSCILFSGMFFSVNCCYVIFV